MVSRDVIFDESKGWDWTTSNKEDTSGSFQINISQYGNHGIDDSITTPNQEETAPTPEPNMTMEDEEDEEDNGDDGDEAEPVLRRSQRERKQLGYLDDYILLAELEGERLLLSIKDEPWSYQEAKEKKEWRDACQDEIKSIVKTRTWDLVKLPAGAKAI